ncbi:MAG: endonuclease/exonuclease/phosphatase family protein [Rikenellaceae bacterium]
MKINSFASTIIIVLLASVGIAQTPHTILFYNVENLFDTIDTPSKRDEDYTPQGRYAWDSESYHTKLGNIEHVVNQITSTTSHLPTLIGLAEVETRGVLEDLVATGELAEAHYSIVHYESPDQRGIDVALLFRPDRFTLEGSCAERTMVSAKPRLRTRDILTAWGSMGQQQLFVVVVHWPSRMGGAEQSEFLRVACAEQVRGIIDSVRLLRPDSQFVVMGDMNDDPTDSSLCEALGAKGHAEQVERGDLFNPYFEILLAGGGSLAYQNKWYIFDNIVVSGDFLKPEGDNLALRRSIYSPEHYGNIFSSPQLLEQEGRYRGYPRRSFSDGKFANGYSDHLPVFIEVE